MKINHFALYTNNLEKLKHFYEKYFDAVSNEMYYNEKTGLKTYFLTFEDGCKLELMYSPKIVETNKTGYEKGFIHLAFSTGSKSKVDELTRQIENDGYSILSAPRTTGDGYYESCISDPDGNQIEITE